MTTMRGHCDAQWALRDSNPRPIGYEPTALTNWAKGPLHMDRVLYGCMEYTDAHAIIFFA